VTAPREYCHKFATAVVPELGLGRMNGMVADLVVVVLHRRTSGKASIQQLKHGNFQKQNLELD
jgi:hypothetical protein